MIGIERKQGVLSFSLLENQFFARQLLQNPLNGKK